MTVSARLGIALSAFAMLLGADSCPLRLGDGTTSPSASSGTALDLGGTQGATWTVTSERLLTATLRSAGRVAAKTTELSPGVVTLLGQTIDVGSLCWRNDVVCPQQVLPAALPLVQPEGSSARPVLGFNRRGPLARWPAGTGLAALLDGRELSAQLASGSAAEGPCALGPASMILATAEDGDPSASVTGDAGAQARRTTRLRGRITVAYDGGCVSYGGSGLVEAGSSLELSVGFTATRD